MIKYNLKCHNNHEFESWFSDSKEFEKLKDRKLLECIYCSSTKISKSIMSPMITGIKNKKNLFIIHAGTKVSEGNIVSAGGRVLNIVSKGKNFQQIRKKIIKFIKKINWKGGFYRKDIGWRVIKKL